MKKRAGITQVQKSVPQERDRETSEASLILLLLDCIDPLVQAIEANTTRVLALAAILEREGYYGEAQILRKAAREAASDLLAGSDRE